MKTIFRDETIAIILLRSWGSYGERGLYLKGPMLYDLLINVGMIARVLGICAGSSEIGPITTLDVGAYF